MYKRKLNQVSLFDNPAMFGGIALNPENEWVKLAGMSVLTLNLQKRLRLLLRFIFAYLRRLQIA